MTERNSQLRFEDYFDLTERVRGLAEGERNVLRETFRDLLALLNELNTPYALFGAFAVSIYVTERRATQDIDIVTTPDVMNLFRERANHFGFREIGKSEDALIRTFVHRTGVPVDVLFDEHGFADLQHTSKVTLKGIGSLAVASAVDVAYSKLRTQIPDWKRSGVKRATDYADLISLLQNNSDLAEELLARIIPRMHISGRDALSEMQETLMRACRDARVPYPDDSFVTQFTHWKTVIGVVAVLLILAVITFLLVTILGQTASGAA